MCFAASWPSENGEGICHTGDGGMLGGIEVREVDWIHRLKSRRKRRLGRDWVGAWVIFAMNWIQSCSKSGRGSVVSVLCL